METQQQERQQETANPSASSSPSHEFSFTLSLHSSETTPTTTTASSKTKTAPLAIDLSPADDIFFHGHLLPLHFLSHLQAASSPRSSINSVDGSFSLPMKELLQDQEKKPVPSCTYQVAAEDQTNNEYQVTHTGNCNKSKPPFSLFSLAKWRKQQSSEISNDSENYNHHQQQQQQQRRKKLKFDVSQFLKRYINMVKPLLSSITGKEERREKIRVRRQSYSFSGGLTRRPADEELIRGGRRRGDFSAPASMRTSPTNSGLLLATAGIASPTSDSTMEELQAAIQSAIAHCKNSISAVDDEKPVN